MGKYELGGSNLYDAETAMKSLIDKAPREISIGGQDAVVELALTRGDYDRTMIEMDKNPRDKAAERALDNVIPIIKAFEPRVGWEDYANCLGTKEPNIFFPGRGANTKAAKEICRGCVVKRDCLETALLDPDLKGIWGELTHRERDRLRNQRAQVARSITSD
jgi:WhiB family redox-sensing transcriptional regulator